MRNVHDWRQNGLPVFYTIDAGPNVHVITRRPYIDKTLAQLREIRGVETVLTATPGDGIRLIDE